MVDDILRNWAESPHAARSREETVADVEALGEEIRRLRARVETLTREVTMKDGVLARKNRELDELHYVWCNGGCGGGVHRFCGQPVTGAIVAAADHQARRLRSWWNNRCFREGVRCTCGHAPASHRGRHAICTDCPCEQYAAPTVEAPTAPTPPAERLARPDEPLGDEDVTERLRQMRVKATYTAPSRPAPPTSDLTA